MSICDVRFHSIEIDGDTELHKMVYIWDIPDLYRSVGMNWNLPGTYHVQDIWRFQTRPGSKSVRFSKINAYEIFDF